MSLSKDRTLIIAAIATLLFLILAYVKIFGQTAIVPVGPGWPPAVQIPASAVNAAGTVSKTLLFTPDNTIDIGANGANRPRSLFLAGSAVIAGNVAASQLFASGIVLTGCAAAGCTFSGNDSPTSRQVTIKETIDRTAFVCAALTCDLTVATLNPRTFVAHVVTDLTTTFACASVCTTSTLSYVIGKTAGGNQYLLSVDADAVAGQFGVTAAQLGASLAPTTTPTEIGDVGNWASSTTITLRMTSGTGNIGNGTVTNFSQGSITLWLTATVLQ